MRSSFFRISFSFLLILIAVACSGSKPGQAVPEENDTDSQGTSTSASIERLQISTPAPSIPKGTFAQFDALAIFDSGETQDIREQAVWTSSDETVISSDPATPGKFLALETGQATIVAQYQDISASFLLTVGDAQLLSVDIDPQTLTAPKGKRIQLDLTGFYSDNSTHSLAGLEWRSSNEQVVVVEGESFIGRGVGSATLTAKVPGLEEISIEVTITAAIIESIVIESTTTEIPLGATIELSAFAIFSDQSKTNVSEQVSWQFDANHFIDKGLDELSRLFQSTSMGNVSFEIGYQNFQAGYDVKVVSPVITSISIDTVAPTIAKGRTMQLVAIALYTDGSEQNISDSAEWLSSDTGIASVDYLKGQSAQLKAIAQGTVAISASIGQIQGQTNIEVTAAELDVLEIFTPTLQFPLGGRLQLEATGIYSDNTKVDLTDIVDWQSLNQNVASFSPSVPGLLEPNLPGEVVVQADYAGFIVAQTINVSDASLTAIQVEGDEATIAKGLKTQFRATGVFSDGSKQDLTTQVAWDVDDTNLASISNTVESAGELTANQVGVVSVSASFQGFSASRELTIVDANLVQVDIDISRSVVAKGISQRIIAYGVFSDGTRLDISDQVVWDSSDNQKVSINMVDDYYYAIANDVGGSTISAQLNGVVGSVQLVVSSAVMISLEVNPQNIIIHAGLETQLNAVAVFTDGSTIDVTREVVWQSSSPNISIISNAGNSSGLAQAVSVGTSVITAKYLDHTDTATVTINDAQLQQIEISPGLVSIANGNSIQLQATGVYSDGTTQSLTERVVWSIEMPALGHVGNSQETAGLLTARQIGSTQVFASFDGISASLAVEFTDAVLSSINIDSAYTKLPKGTQIELSASGNYTDGSIRDLSSEVSWASGNNAIAEFVDNGARLLGKAVGTTSVSASYNGVSGSFFIEVSEAILTSIEMSQVNATIANHTGIQLRALGTFSDDSEQDITDLVLWSSAQDKVAVANNALGLKGWVDAINPGVAEISASINGFEAIATVTVSDAQLERIEIFSVVDSFAVNTQLQLYVTGFYSGNKQQDLTRYVSWSIVQPSILSIDRSLEHIGLASGLAEGTVSVGAEFLGHSNSKILTIVDQPDLAVGLAQIAAPNVIFNDGSDVSNIYFFVRAADPSVFVPDSTQIDIEVLDGSATLTSTTVATTDGSAQISLTSTHNGLIRLRATVRGTTISRNIYIYAADNLGKSIVGRLSTRYNIDGDVLKQNSRVGFSIANVSTRPFFVVEFSVRNNGVVLESTNAPELLNQYIFDPGSVVGITYQLDDDLVAPQLELRYVLQDRISGIFFAYGVIVSPIQ